MHHRSLAAAAAAASALPGGQKVRGFWRTSCFFFFEELGRLAFAIGVRARPRKPSAEGVHGEGGAHGAGAYRDGGLRASSSSAIIA